MKPTLDCLKCRAAPDSAFGCLTPAQRSRLAKIAIPHTYLRGQMIFYEGNPALAVFCLRSGMVKLTRHSGPGQVVVVGLRTAGDIFGYRAALAGLPYGVSAEAVEPSMVCTIPRECFLALLEECDRLAFRLLQRLVQEVLFAEAKLAERGEHLTKRTARLLVSLAESTGRRKTSGTHVPVPARRGDMAQLIGTTPESLSRVLHQLMAQGLVKVSRREVAIKDLAGLRKLAHL